MNDQGVSQPLINRGDEDAEQDQSPVAQAPSHQDDNKVDDGSPTSFVWILSFAAGLSGLLFGYDTGVISSTLVSINDDLDGAYLTISQKAIIASATSFCALLASPLAGYLSDVFGRRLPILVTSCLFAVGALLQAVASTVWLMVVGRGVVGLAVGAASFIVPLYIGELAPRRWRGRLVTMSALFITLGQVVAYLIGVLFSRAPAGWRWMVGLGAVPAVLQICLVVGMPESARWLAKVGRIEAAEHVLKKVHGSDSDKAGVVRAILLAIEQSVEEEARLAADCASQRFGVLGDLFHVARNRRALIIACLLQTSQQIGGFNALMYFSASIFALLGFKNPILASLTVAVTNYFFTIVAFLIVDNVGRRRLLLWSVPFMVFGHTLTAILFGFIDLHSDASKQSSPLVPWLLVASFTLFVSAYAVGLGNVPWQQGELFPLRVRGLGSSISTSTNWLSNTLVGMTFLPMMEVLTPTGTFLVYAGVCLLVWVLIWQCYPETSGMSLEDVGQLLDRGYGVKESMERWRVELANRAKR